MILVSLVMEVLLSVVFIPGSSLMEWPPFRVFSVTVIEGKGELGNPVVANTFSQIACLLTFHSSEQVLWPHKSVWGKNDNSNICQKEKKQRYL